MLYSGQLFMSWLYFKFLYCSRFSPKKTAFLTILYMTPLIILNTAVSVLSVSSGISRILILTLTLPSLFFFGLLSADKGCRFLFAFCIANTFFYWILVITNLLDLFFGNTGWILLISRLIAFPAAKYLVWNVVKKSPFGK